MRAEGTTWRIDPEHGWTCALCQGFIPAGEPFRASGPGDCATAAVCLSCIASAVGPVLPGKPAHVVVEQAPWSRESPDLLFDLSVDGEEVGTLTVEAEIAEEQRVPALLALVCNALEERRDREALPPLTELVAEFNATSEGNARRRDEARLVSGGRGCESRLYRVEVAEFAQRPAEVEIIEEKDGSNPNAWPLAEAFLRAKRGAGWHREIPK